jgi:methylated-DNA-[protein]-cysteine S-methyltransferase
MTKNRLVHSLEWVYESTCFRKAKDAMTLTDMLLKKPLDHWQMPIHTPLGRMTLLANTQGLCGAWFDQQKHLPDLQHMPWGPSQCWLLQAKQQLSEYFSGKRTQFDLPLSPFGGSDFQRTVWQALAMIPFGRFASYADIARYLGQPQSARAVGTAVGRNPLSIFLPCHRVVASSGALTGYAGGLDRKVALLQIEGMVL